MIHAHGVLCGYDKIPLGEIEANCIRNVVSRMQQAIQKMRAAARDDSALVFVKLNHRSPKDVAIEPKNTKTACHLRRILENIDENDKISQVWPDYFIDILPIYSTNLGLFVRP